MSTERPTDDPGRQLRIRVGTNIRRAREAARLSQEKLSELIPEDQATVSRWETGRHIPRGEALMRLAGILGVDVVDLYEPLPDEREPNGHDTPAAA